MCIYIANLHLISSWICITAALFTGWALPRCVNYQSQWPLQACHIHASYLGVGWLSVHRHWPATPQSNTTQLFRAWALCFEPTRGREVLLLWGLASTAAPLLSLLSSTGRERERETEEKTCNPELQLIWLLNIRKEQFDRAAGRGKV